MIEDLKLYGLPKIHKDGAPIRPIISACKSPTDNLSWILDRILHPLLCLIPILVLNSVDFISKLKTLNLDWKSDNIIFIAADIESLYTNVPILEAIDSIIDLCIQFNIDTYDISIEDFRKLLSLALCDNYFKYNDKYYAQGDCLAMGNRLSVVAANCFVYSLEKKLFSKLNTNAKHLCFWVRYIDDIFIIIDKTQVSYDLLKLEMESLHSNIKFTYTEVVALTEQRINFLDVCIFITNGILKIGLYRKPTYSNTVLNFQSSHTYNIKLGIDVGQFKRVRAICNSLDTLKESTAIITNTLINSGYPIDVINKAQNRAMINIRPNNNKTISPTNSSKVPLCLPYLGEKSIRSFSRTIRNTTFSDKIRPIFYTGQSIGSTLIHTNLYKLPDLSLGSICKFCNSKICECSIPNVIYQLTCKLRTHNNSIYIGETSKTAYKRLVEHWLATFNKNVNLSIVLQSILIYIIIVIFFLKINLY